MKINIETDEGGVIRSWTSFPLKEGEPVFEIKNPYRIRIGFDKVVDGKIVHDEAGYKTALEKQVKRVRIQFLKSELAKSDYKALKRLEGELSDEEWEETKRQRREWRDEINRLEEETK